MQFINKKILLVEDEILIAMDESSQLKNRGYLVETVTSGEEAIETLENSRDIDLVLMDIDLGDGRMDGTEAAGKIVEHHDIPVVFVSSHIEEEVVRKTESITSYGYVVKNSGITVLDTAIKMAMKLHLSRLESEKRREESENAYHEMEFRELRLQHLNRILGSIRNMNRLIIGTSDRIHLLDGVCRLLIETSGYRNAWIVLLEDEKPVEPFFHAGFGSSFEPMTGQLLNGRIPPCAVKALETGELVVTTSGKDYCAGCVFQELYSPSDDEDADLTLPIRRYGRNLGWITVRTGRDFSLNLDEQGLFQEIADDIGYALEGIAIEESRRRSELSLQESEENLRITLESIGDAVIATDEEGCVTRMNPVAENLTGWKMNEAFGRDLSKVFHIVSGRTGEPVDSPVKKILDTGEIIGLANHTVLIARDGTRYQIADSGAPIKKSSGEISGIVLVFRDVSEEYRVRREISDSRDLLESTMDAIPDAIGILDDDFNVIRYNDAGYRMLHACHEEVIGKKCFELVHRTTPCEVCAVKKAYSSKKVEQLDRYEEELGIWVNLRAYPILNEEGRLVKVIEHFQDITSRKKAEEELHKRLHYEKGVAACSGVLLSPSDNPMTEALESLIEEIDVSRIGIFKNFEENGRLHMCRIAEACGPGITSEIDDPQLQRVDYFETSPELVKILSSGAHFFSFTTALSREARTFFELRNIRSVLVLPIFLDNKWYGHIDFEECERDRNWETEDIRLLSTVAEIFGGYLKQKNDAEAIRELLDQKDILLTEVHHRVKNNMTTIRSLLSLQSCVTTDKDVQWALHEAMNRITIMANVYENLYTAGDFEEIELYPFLDEVIESAFASYENLGNFRVRKDLVEMQVPATIGVHIGIIVNELLTNCFKYAFPDKREGEVLVSIRPENDGAIRLAVTDNGIGIPEAVITGETDGMGMYLIRNLVEQNNGRMDIRNSNGADITICVERGK